MSSSIATVIVKEMPVPFRLNMMILVSAVTLLMLQQASSQEVQEGIGDSSPLDSMPNTYELKSNLRHMLENDYNITQVRQNRKIDSSLLARASHKDKKYPEIQPTGEKTRRTFDFTRRFRVGRSCHDIQAIQGATVSGIYLIHPPNVAQGPWKVFCDMESDGGGWMVFQVRDDVEPHENFDRNWEDYKTGFGSYDREFWLGNTLIWAVTNVDTSMPFELHVDLEDWSGNRRYLRYESFRIENEKDLFRLNISDRWDGNTGNSLAYHNGRPFSTFDKENSITMAGKKRTCAKDFHSGWWYKHCIQCNLNGLYRGGHFSGNFSKGVTWKHWTNYNYSLKKTVMKLRPRRRGRMSMGHGNYFYPNNLNRNGKELSIEKVNVPELMADINTLSKPTNDTKHAEKSEF